MRVPRREEGKAAGGTVLWFGKCAAGKNERRLFLCAVKNPQDARVPVGCVVSLCFLCNIVYMPACFLSLLLFWYGTG